MEQSTQSQLVSENEARHDLALHYGILFADYRNKVLETQRLDKLLEETTTTLEALKTKFVEVSFARDELANTLREKKLVIRRKR